MDTIEQLRRRNRRSHYPWEKWFSRDRFTIRRGVDYHCLDHGMAQQVRNWATRVPGVEGVSILLRSGSMTVTVRRRPLNGTAP